ncbi:MAG: lactate racemase domain-containing protein, partial [Spirochaetia bacterium]|nr:lactate racemase domain-containing protein [Spirochaetia bacterium]
MRIELPYLDRTLPLEFPDGNLLAIAEPNDYLARGDAACILGTALEHPLAADGGEGKSLAEFLGGGKRLLIIVNDATRPTPTEAMLNNILPAAREAGFEDTDITLVVATGGHRAPVEEEYRQILGGLF